jgi:hypothetical protein
MRVRTHAINRLPLWVGNRLNGAAYSPRRENAYYLNKKDSGHFYFLSGEWLPIVIGWVNEKSFIDYWNTDESFEWLNRLFEPVVLPVRNIAMGDSGGCDCCDCCCENREDEQMNCGCTGKPKPNVVLCDDGVLYKIETDGTLTPLTTLPIAGDYIEPPLLPNDDEPIVQASNACRKAITAWEVVARLVDDTIETMSPLGYAEIIQNIYRFWNDFRTNTAWFDATMTAQWDYLNAMETAFGGALVAPSSKADAISAVWDNGVFQTDAKEQFICGIIDRLANSTKYTPDDVAIIQDYNFNTGEDEVDDYLSTVLRLWGSRSAKTASSWLNSSYRSNAEVDCSFCGVADDPNAGGNVPQGYLKAYYDTFFDHESNPASLSYDNVKLASGTKRGELLPYNAGFKTVLWQKGESTQYYVVQLNALFRLTEAVIALNVKFNMVYNSSAGSNANWERRSWIWENDADFTPYANTSPVADAVVAGSTMSHGIAAPNQAVGFGIRLTKTYRAADGLPMAQAAYAQINSITASFTTLSGKVYVDVPLWQVVTA